MCRFSCSAAFAVVVCPLLCAKVSYPQEPEANKDYGTAWHILPVPGTWDEHTAGALDNYDGFAWYRCLVTLPGGWVGKDVGALLKAAGVVQKKYLQITVRLIPNLKTTSTPTLTDWRQSYSCPPQE